VDKISSAAAAVAQLRGALLAEQVVVEQKKAATQALIESIGREKAAADDAVAASRGDEEAAGALAAAVAAAQAECAADLAAAEPVIRAAEAALNSLDKGALGELRSFSAPAPEVVAVVASCMVLTAPGGALPRDLSWAAGKKWMGAQSVDAFLKSLLAFDRDNVPPACVDRVERDFLGAPTFRPEAVRVKSAAAAGLCGWVTNVCKYFRIYQVSRGARHRMHWQRCAALRAFALVSGPARRAAKVVAERGAARARSPPAAAQLRCQPRVHLIFCPSFLQVVAPKRAALAESNRKLGEAGRRLAGIRGRVAELRARVVALEAGLAAATAEKNAAVAQAERTAGKAALAARLISGLGGERARWGAAIKDIRAREGALLLHQRVYRKSCWVQLPARAAFRIRGASSCRAPLRLAMPPKPPTTTRAPPSSAGTLVGDSLLSAAFVAYAGAFNAPLRAHLVHECWLPDARRRGLPLAPAPAPLDLLADAGARARWAAEGLPVDSHSVENGAVVAASRRWPLLVDPQLQGAAWVRGREGPRGLRVVQQGAPKYMETVSWLMPHIHSKRRSGRSRRAAAAVPAPDRAPFFVFFRNRRR
jgi:hypothetical protein